MEECPVVELIVDSHEQKTRRPKGGPQQTPFYSGKKKTHTRKSQAVVDLEGRVQAVSESVPGSTRDLALRERSGVMERLNPGEAAGADKAYTGAEKHFPGCSFDGPVNKPPQRDLPRGCLAGGPPDGCGCRRGDVCLIRST